MRCVNGRESFSRRVFTLFLAKENRDLFLKLPDIVRGSNLVAGSTDTRTQTGQSLGFDSSRSQDICANDYIDETYGFSLAAIHTLAGNNQVYSNLGTA